jgi:thiol-disulfide isomerase/thioredoxin
VYLSLDFNISYVFFHRSEVLLKISWIVVLSLIGIFLAGLGVFFSKQMTANYGKADIDKTLSSLDKLKAMQNEGAFDFKFIELEDSLNAELNTNNSNTSTKLNSNSNFGSNPNPGSNPGSDVKARDFSELKQLSDLKGQLILLNFWASWCEPCIQEFPDMIRLVEQRPNIVIVAINRDQNKEDAIKFIETFPEAKGKILFYWDPKGEITSLYGTEVLPESYLITYDFKVLKKIIGIEDWDHPNILRFLDSL